ncbi:MAG: radical SAM protein [Kiritimatiellia bacterium]|jgi:radical SAM superfamily enzyme YgiQ (UPF0313 family)|nr:radical SAM protein [Kiritimatiellia bacterium]
MNVVLVYKGRYQVREALDLETLAAVLNGGGHNVSLVYDADPFGVTDNVLQVPWLSRRLTSPERWAQKIAALAPDVVIFSVLQATYRWSRAVAENLRSLARCPVVFAGLHPSLVPERVMRDLCVDYVVQGETEPIINSLLEAIASGEGLPSVGNLWHREKDGPGDGADAEPVFTFRVEPTNLDALPLPDKELFRPHISHSYSYVAMVSRGCPFQCSFCEETCSREMYGSNYFRRKSVDTVMRELVAGMQKYRYREVIFKDSYLSGSSQWLEDLMIRYRKEIAVPFKCFCTISGFEERTAQLLKEGGCYCIEFGLQTWNEDIRHRVLQRGETNGDAKETFDICARHGLWYDVDHMFGLPGETEEDHRSGALQYSELPHLNRVKVHHLVYLPGAGIIDRALEAGTVSADIREQLADGIETDFYDAGAAGNPRLTAAYGDLFKLLPAMPKRILGWFLSGHRVLVLRYVPRLVIALLQGLMALRSRDLRFAEYIRQYPRKILRSFRQ